MFKNTGSQKLTVLAFADAGHASLDAGEPVTGDAANISCKVEQDDDGTQSATDDAAPTEVEDGQYRFDLTQAETNGDKITFYPESSTAGVQVVALPSNVIYTRPPYFSDLGIESDGDLTKVNAVNGHTAQTGDSYARIGAAGASLTDVGGMSTGMKAEVKTEAASALSDAGVNSTRAGYLDNLNIGENVAGTSEVTSIQNNTKAVRVVPQVIERPDSGTTTYRIELLLYDDQGNMEAPDSAPTLDLVDESGNDRTSRLGSTTGTLVSTGRYRWVYTATDTDDLEQLVWTFSVVEGGATRLYGNGSLVVDTTAVDFTAADRAKLDTLHDTRIPGVVQPQTGDAYARLGAPAGADIAADIAAVPTAAENRQELDSSSSRLADIEEDTQDIQSRIPAALTSGRMDSDVGSIQAAAVDTILDEPITEPSGVTAWASMTVRAGLAWLVAMARNKKTSTAATLTLRDDADSSDIATSTQSDDGATYTQGEWS